MKRDTRVRIVFLTYLILFSAYAYVYSLKISIPLLSVIALLMAIVIAPRRCCSTKFLCLPIAFNVCGSIAPLYTCIVSFLYTPSIQLTELISMLLISIAVASINTYLSTRYILVNVVRYIVINSFLSYSLFYTYPWFPYTFPLTSVLGILIGSDIHMFSLLSVLKRVRAANSILEIGGAKEVDAIVLSALSSFTMLLAYKLLF